jgi:probable phosphomutase (TIGR03848 family)
VGTVILIRHACSVANTENVLAGQTPGVRLDAQGLEQSANLAEALGNLPVSKVFVSPLERCLATISPWIARYGQGVEIESDSRIIEPDYGTWSGRKLEELSLEPLWRDVQQNPESVIFPRGERFIDVWSRVQDFYHALTDFIENSTESSANIVVVSHGDIIKFLIANVLKMEFKNFQSLIVEPASISLVQISASGARLMQYNRSEQSISELLKKNIVATLGGESQSNRRAQ